VPGAIYPLRVPVGREIGRDLCEEVCYGFADEAPWWVSVVVSDANANQLTPSSVPFALGKPGYQPG